MCTAGIFTVRLPNAREPSQNGTFAHSNPACAVPAQRPSSSIATLQKPKNFAAAPPAKRVNGIAHVAVPAQRVTSAAKMPQLNGVAVRPNTEQSGVVHVRPKTEQSGVVQRAVAPSRSMSPATPEQPHVVALQQWKKLNSVGQSAAAAQKPTSLDSQQQLVQSPTLPEDTLKQEASQSQVCRVGNSMGLFYTADEGQDGMGHLQRMSGNTLCCLQEFRALKAQVEALKIAVDAIQHHLNHPTAALPAAIAATSAQKGEAVSAASAAEEVSLPPRSSGGVIEVTFLCSHPLILQNTALRSCASVTCYITTH